MTGKAQMPSATFQTQTAKRTNQSIVIDFKFDFFTAQTRIKRGQNIDSAYRVMQLTLNIRGVHMRALDLPDKAPALWASVIGRVAKLVEI